MYIYILNKMLNSALKLQSNWWIIFNGYYFSTNKIKLSLVLQLLYLKTPPLISFKKDFYFLKLVFHFTCWLFHWRSLVPIQLKSYVPGFQQTVWGKNWLMVCSKYKLWSLQIINFNVNLTGSLFSNNNIPLRNQSKVTMLCI